MKSFTHNKKNGAEADAPVGCNLPACRVTDAFFVMANGFYTKVLYREILWLESFHNYLDIHLKGEQKICVIHPLSLIENILPPDSFIRIHRSVIVNVHAIERFTGNVLYIGKRHLDVSRPYRAQVFGCFDIVQRKRSREST